MQSMLSAIYDHRALRREVDTSEDKSAKQIK